MPTMHLGVERSSARMTVTLASGQAVDSQRRRILVPETWIRRLGSEELGTEELGTEETWRRRPGKMAFHRRRQSRCDKASPVAAVMLHLRSCYVSKAAILTIPVRSVPVENRSPA